MSILVRSGFPVRKPEVWLRQADNENVVYDPETSAVHIC